MYFSLFRPLALSALLACSAPLAAADDVRLVLQITVDGLRADLLTRYQDSFGRDGFRWLQEEGVVYRNAHYQHANTETIVGHATLATGAQPAVHGMVGNVWYDRASGELAYNIEDGEAPLLKSRLTNSAVESAQVDPAQKQSRSQGRSPRALLAPTFADSLAVATAGKAKLFAVSGKDRSAVAMAGKAGKAFWYSTENGDFITSRYYFDAYPNWVEKWNGQRLAESYSGQQWALTASPEDYLLAAQDARPYEIDLKGYGKIFPHAFGDIDHPLFFTRLLVSPVADRLMLDFGKALVAAEGLGRDEFPDYLSLSFSGVDAVNHFFGPSSLENEAAMRELDSTVAELLSYVDGIVGLEHTLVVLSADHGMAEMPEYMTELGYQAGRLYTDEVLAAANAGAEAVFEVASLVQDYYRPYLYLDTELIAEHKLDAAEVEQVIIETLNQQAGIALAIASREVLVGEQPAGLRRQIQNNTHPQRSGDIYVVQQPYWFNFDKGPIAAMHGSPWAYDTHVPIIFAGAGIKARTSQRAVHPIDVAPTMAAFLGMTAPAAAQGQPLWEVFSKRR